MILPNVIIAGAPKCGTTSLFRYLADHPDACSSKVKETRYLLDANYPLFDPQNTFLRDGLSGYSRFFSIDEANTRSVILEATPDYIYQDTPHEALRKFPSVPYVIFVFRRPAVRILSYFNYAQNNLAQLPKDWSFEHFVDLLLADSVSNEYPIVRESLRHSRYADYLQRWIDTVGRDNICAILFEELTQDPLSQMKALAQRIGLDPTFYDSYEFPRENPTIFIRNQNLHRIYRSLWNVKLPRPVRKIGGAVYRTLNVASDNQRRVSAQQSQLRRLDRVFAEANQKLASLTGLDISCWDVDRSQ
jgi:hypothetical protein